MKNLEIARIFKETARILEIKGDNPFKIRAYERAAQNIESLSENIEDIVKDERLNEIPGIGHDLSERIKEFVLTGKINAFEELKESVPEGFLELLNIPSVGPKTAKLLFEQLKIRNLRELEAAIKNNRIRNIPGIKEKTIENISKGIGVLKRGKERMTLAQAAFTAEEFISEIKKINEVKNITPAGSLRRQKETVRDIDILVISAEPEKIMDHFTKLPNVKDILSKGRTKSSIRTKEDIQVDCRVLEEDSFGAALLYFTGSKNFNIKLRMIAIKKGMKLSEYGLFSDGKTKERFIAGRTEKGIFESLGMQYIEPELREDNGEIELAIRKRLPQLIEVKDIKGDLHCHSTYSDGSNSIKEMAEAAVKKGYSYIAITDHSQSLKVAGGLNLDDLKRKKREIDKLNKSFKDFRILFGTEAEIDSEGKIDYDDDVLKEFDIVVAAVHSGFKQSKAQLTKRIINACKNKYVHIIAHPTGRLWGSRDAYELDFEQVLKTAKETNTALEINAFPNRLDLNDHNTRRAKESGVKISINTDSHSTEQLEAIKFGVAVARRGWLCEKDVLNTLTAEKLLRAIKK